MVMNNLAHRPVRTALSVAAVAVMVVLIISTVGLVNGIVDEMAHRMKGVGADILVRPPGSAFMTGLSSSPMSEKIGGKLAEMPHVKFVAPVLIQSAGGLTLINGIDDSYRKVIHGFDVLEGRDLGQGQEIIVDDIYATDNKLKVGQKLKFWDHDFTLVGIVRSGRGARLYVPKAVAQDLLGSTGTVNMFYVSVDDSTQVNATVDAMRAVAGLEGYKINSMEEYTSQMTVSNISPALKPFVRVMITIAVIIGFLVIFLAMYTTVLERTREIGILKSLGASKLYIANLILWETAMVAVLGIAVGIGAAILLRKVVLRAFPALTIEITQEWLLAAAGIAMLASLVGALYPAWRAARQDPIAALAYE
jgi:putative ABC transport system permease protein